MAGAVISVLEELIHLGLGSGHGAAPHDPGCTGGRTERRVRRHMLQKEGTRGRGRLGWGIAHRCPRRACGSRILTSDGQTPRLAAPPSTHCMGSGGEKCRCLAVGKAHVPRRSAARATNTTRVYCGPVPVAARNSREGKTKTSKQSLCSAAQQDREDTVSWNRGSGPPPTRLWVTQIV